MSESLKRIQVVFNGNGSRVIENTAAIDESSSTVLNFDVDLAGIGIGGDLWPAATMFSNIISHQCYKESFFAPFFQNKRVLELGSGTGLCGILIDKIFKPTEVVITDQPSHMNLIATNMKLNCASSLCISQDLDWTNKAAIERDFSVPFDVILAMECVYNVSLYLPLIESILHCANEHTIIFLGLTRQFAKAHFFDKLAKNGLSYTLLPHEALPLRCRSETGGDDCGIFVVRKYKM